MTKSHTQRFCLDGKNFFLTYPQNDTLPEDAMNRLKDHFKDDLECAIVAQEKHQDGNNHIHIYFKLVNRFKTTKNTYFNFIGDKQGNYQTCKKPVDVIKYVIKTGAYITHNIDPTKYIDEVKTKTQRQSKGTFKKITDNIKNNTYKTIDDINEHHADILIQHYKKVETYLDYIKQQQDSNDIKEYYEQLYSDVVWKPFQKTIIDITESPVDTRTINWIYDNEGNKGKSYLTTYLQMYRNAYVITGGKHQDIIRHYKNNRTIIFDLSRDYLDNNESIYNLMEQFKNGYLLDGKYEGQVKRFIPPHIIVMSNTMPKTHKMSKDRWNIIDISNKQDTGVQQKVCEFAEDHYDNKIIETESGEHFVVDVPNDECNEEDIPIIPIKQPKHKTETMDNYNKRITYKIDKDIINKEYPQAPSYATYLMNQPRYTYNRFTQKYWDRITQEWFQDIP